MNEYLIKSDELANRILSKLITIDSGEKDVERKQTFFYYSITFKSITTIKSVLSLLSSMPNNMFNNMSAGILLRSVMTDLVLAYYVSVKEDEPNTNLNHVIENIYYNHYRYVKSKVDIYQQLYVHDFHFPEIQKQFQEAEKQYLDEKGELPTHIRKEISTLTMIKYIQLKVGSEENRFTTVLFEQFDIYSKLAHFGELTMRLIAENFNDPKSKLGCGVIKDGIDITFSFCLALLEKVIGSKYEEFQFFDDLYNECDKLKLCT